MFKLFFEGFVFIRCFNFIKEERKGKKRGRRKVRRRKEGVLIFFI